MGYTSEMKLTVIGIPRDLLTNHYIHALELTPHQKFFTTLGVEETFIHYFAHSRELLQHDFPTLKKALVKDGMLWISWPKKTSKIASDLDENIIREIGLNNGLVDVKVCAVDDDWSGLKFVYRLKDR